MQDPAVDAQGLAGDPAAVVGKQKRDDAHHVRRLGVPVCNALPHAFDLFEEEFRKAEGFFAMLARLGGTDLFRTHEVGHVRAVLAAMDALDVTPGGATAG